MDKQLQNLIDTIEILKVQKGDAIIVKIDDRLSQSVYVRITEKFKNALKKIGKSNIPILILDNRVEIQVLRLGRANERINN